MRLPVFLSAALMVLTAGVNASASVSFTLASYTVNAYSGSNGLLIETANLLGPTTFELTNEGDMYMADLFRIWTPESNVGLGEDTIAQNISVDFEFTAPAPAFGGSVEGVTVGDYTFFVFQQGEVNWDGPTVIPFGSTGDGQLQVELFDATFNKGFLGLNEGESNGRNVKVKFTLLEKATLGNPPPGAVPEPSTMAVWSLLCVSGLLTTRRRRS